MTFSWKNEKVNHTFAKRDAAFESTTYGVRDLWTKDDRGTTKTDLAAEVPGHDVLMLRLAKIN